MSDNPLSHIPTEVHIPMTSVHKQQIQIAKDAATRAHQGVTEDVSELLIFGSPGIDVLPVIVFLFLSNNLQIPQVLMKLIFP